MARTCEQCGESIYRYCHSEAGPYKAYAWTTIDGWSDEDQRNGTYCESHGDWPWVHVPEPEGDFLEEHVQVIQVGLP